MFRWQEMQTQYVQLYNAVAVPFPDVRGLLLRGALPALDAPRGVSLEWLAQGDATLEIEVAGVHLTKEVAFSVSGFHDVPGRLPLGRLRLRWEPVEHAEVFPAVQADLEIEPIDDERTMISLLASYDPPLGRLGRVVDKMALHRVAEAALHRFFDQLVHEIRDSAATQPG